MNFYSIFLAIAALLLAICSAFFSITGLSQLFAGASLAIMVMAGSLEFAKLVSASFIYFYWEKLGMLIKTYLITGILILVLISSLGIYGFLTSAYQITSDRLNIAESQIENLEIRKDRYLSFIEDYTEDLQQYNQAITSLSEGITNNQIQYVDPETGQLVTTTSRVQRESIEAQITDFRDRRNEINSRIDAYSDSVNVYENRILDASESATIDLDIGPLRFISNVSSIPMDDVVNYLSLAIIFVFDPLAVILVIAFSMSIKLNKKENEDEEIESIFDEIDNKHTESKEKTEKKSLPKEKAKIINVDNSKSVIEKRPNAKARIKLKESNLLDSIEKEEEKTEDKKDSVLENDNIFQDEKSDKNYPSLT